MQRVSADQFDFSAIIKRLLDEENVRSTEVKPQKDNSILRFHRTSENGEVRLSCRLANESSDLGSEATGSPSILSESSTESDGFSDSCSNSKVFTSNHILSSVCSKCPKHCVSEKTKPVPVQVPSTSSSSKSTSPSTAISNSGTTSSVRREENEENDKKDWKIRKLNHTEEPISLTPNTPDTSNVRPVKVNTAPDKQSIAIGEIGAAECEGIIKILVEAAQNIFCKYPSGEKLEEIHKQQNQYLHMKKTKQVGEPNERTKADVLFASIAYLESKIIEIVQFAKCIPGFKDLSMDDQASLVRDSRTESVIIGGMRLINCKNKVFTTTYGQHFTIEEMASVYSKDFMEQKVMMSKRIVELDMSFEEETLLRAVSITFTDRGYLDDLVAVQNIQNKLLTCLIYIIKKTGKHKCGIRLGQLFNVLINLRDITEVDMNEVKKILLETPAYTNSPVVNDFL